MDEKQFNVHTLFQLIRCDQYSWRPVKLCGISYNFNVYNNFRLATHEALAFIEHESAKLIGAHLVLHCPDPERNGLNDKDCDESDYETQGDINHLGKEMLNHLIIAMKLLKRRSITFLLQLITCCNNKKETEETQNISRNFKA